MDFRDWQKDMVDQLEGAGFKADDYTAATRKLHVLRFNIDKKGENIVSSIDGTIVFVDRWYSGERVEAGDVWFCSTEFRNTVYYAMPLRKITASMIMGLSDDIRKGVIDQLWKTNRAEFEKVFEERYKEEVYSRAYLDAKEENRKLVAALQQQVSELQVQVEHSRMVIDRRSDEDDYVELSSEPEEPERADVPAPAVQAVPIMQAAHAPVPDFNPFQNHGYMRPAPGMPEMRLPDHVPNQGAQMKFDVERVSEETISCREFPDGKYFVHINPGKRYLVVRKHDYGSAICIEGKIRLEGLGRHAPFAGRAPMLAEYSPQYGGILIYL